MINRVYLIITSILLYSCSSFHPIKSRTPEQTPQPAASNQGVQATFLGNSTLHVTDGKTHLLVDGFLSRPSSLQTLLGRIESDHGIVCSELKKAGIEKVDAVLVGHAHHDHALDAPFVAARTGAIAVGSRSYSMVHKGAGARADRDHLDVLTQDREIRQYGRFKVTLVASDHVGSFSCFQRAVEGVISDSVRQPARYTEFKCGKVYAIHIDHPEGSLAVTTTAGAIPNQFRGLKSDALFLAMGLISKECVTVQNCYWQATAGTLDPQVVVPVHWDNFSRKLSRGLAPFPAVVDDVEDGFRWLEEKEGEHRIIIMDLREKLSLRKGRVR